MKIITWNCNMAYRKKATAILQYQPDIVVVPECEHPEKLEFSPGTTLPKHMLWFGANKNKGIGIFSYSDFKFKLLRNYNPELKLIIPIAVKGGGFDFTLFAIWANNPGDPDGQYVTQTWKALEHYNKKLKRKATILAGDFNSNTIWDRPSREGNHTDVVKRLEKKGIYSCYHKHLQQLQGKEQHPTHYLYRHQDKPYHLDYCFASADLVNNIQSVEIGEYNSWAPYSDHVPVMVTFHL
jgi:exonuclease III